MDTVRPEKNSFSRITVDGFLTMLAELPRWRMDVAVYRELRARRGEIVSRSALCDAIRPYCLDRRDSSATDGTLRVAIHHARRKHPKETITPVYGVGYRLEHRT